MNKPTNKDMNLNTTLEIAYEKLRKISPNEAAKNAGCSFDEEKGVFLIDFLGKMIQVRYEKEEIHFLESNEKVPIVWKILILHYLTKATGEPLTGNLVTYKQLQGGDIYYEPFKHRTIGPLLKNFGEHPEKFIALGEKVGGSVCDKGDYCITINIFPYVPVTYILWAGDEEFPPNASILFDETANSYLETEDYAFVASLIVFELAKMTK